MPDAPNILCLRFFFFRCCCLCVLDSSHRISTPDLPVQQTLQSFIIDDAMSVLCACEHKQPGSNSRALKTSHSLRFIFALHSSNRECDLFLDRKRLQTLTPATSYHPTRKPTAFLYGEHLCTPIQNKQLVNTRFLANVSQHSIDTLPRSNSACMAVILYYIFV